MNWYVKDSESPVKEVWEDFYGNLWFVTEKCEEDDLYFGYARLYSMPEFAEWGYFLLEEIKEAVGKNKVWKVDPKYWSNINTYEEGLLNGR